MRTLVEELIAFAKSHEPAGGYFGYGTLVDLLKADSAALKEFTSFFEQATPEQLDAVEDDDTYGWIIGGAADALSLLPDDPRNFRSDAELQELSDNELLDTLCSACIVNDVNAVKHIAARIDVNSQDHNKQTALCYAVGNNHIDCVDVLLANGADPNVVQNCGNTAMHTCASTVSSRQIWRRLVEHGGDAQVKNDQGETASNLLRDVGRSAWVE